MPTLYLVATPIGNLEDITFRAVRVLREVGLIAAEDTRRARKLLPTYDIKTPVTSYHRHSRPGKLARLLQTLEEKDVALISEAGTPGISDPGYELVRAALERGAGVVAVPGPSAIPIALALSGLPSDQFLHLGFLPRQKATRRSLLESLAGETRTLVFFEAPHRLHPTLADLHDVLGERKVAVCRELTKLHEEVFRGTVGQALEHFEQPRGEFTLVVEGATASKPTGEVPLEELRRLKEEGVPAREAVGRIARATGLPRREVYRAWLRLER